MEAYRNRVEAGRLLARALKAYARDPAGLVLGLPRGGVPVAHEVARALGLPLDVFLVRKLGVPGFRELAMGALASGGTRVLNEEVLRSYGIGHRELEAVTEAERKELDRRERTYRGGRPPLQLADRTVILVDDGLATGATMKAAVAAVRALKPARIVVAVPVAPPDTCAELEPQVDALICPLRPPWFSAIGQWYETFDQTTDEEVRSLLERPSPRMAEHGP